MWLVHVARLLGWADSFIGTAGSSAMAPWRGHIQPWEHRIPAFHDGDTANSRLLICILQDWLCIRLPLMFASFSKLCVALSRVIATDLPFTDIS